MSIYVITGGTTGIGAATRSLLLESGHEVFNIDYKGGDFQADLSDPAGVSSAIEAVFSRYPSRRPSGLRKTTCFPYSLAHRTTWLRSDLIQPV